MHGISFRQEKSRERIIRVSHNVHSDQKDTLPVRLGSSRDTVRHVQDRVGHLALAALRHIWKSCIQRACIDHVRKYVGYYHTAYWGNSLACRILEALVVSQVYDIRRDVLLDVHGVNFCIESDRITDDSAHGNHYVFLGSELLAIVDTRIVQG